MKNTTAQQVIEKVEALEKAMSELLAIWNSEPELCDDLLVKLYPFGPSFDELVVEVGYWKEDISERAGILSDPEPDSDFFEEQEEQTAVVAYQIATYSGEISVKCFSDEDTEIVLSRAKGQLRRKVGEFPIGYQSFKVTSRG